MGLYAQMEEKVLAGGLDFQRKSAYLPGLREVCTEFDKRLEDAEKKAEAYRVALTPQEWSIEHSGAWRNKMLDTVAAFAAIREVAEKS